MEKFKFLNQDLNENYINLSVKDMENKNITYIFAKNGVGKTVYSRKIKEESSKDEYKNIEVMIFNNDYIANNLYIPKIDKEGKYGSSTSEKQEEKSYELLIGNNITEEMKKLNELNNNLKELREKFDENENLRKWKYEDIKDFEINKPTFIEITKNLKEYKPLNEEKYEENVVQKIRKIESKIIIEDFEKEVNEIIDLFKKINEKISQYNEIIEIENIIEDSFVINIHKSIIKYLEEKKKIEIQIGSKKISLEEIQTRYKEILDKKTPLANEYNKIIKELKSKINKLISSNSFKKIKDIETYKKHCNFIEEKNVELKKRVEISNKTKEKINTFEMKIDEIKTDFKNIEENLKYYLEKNKFKLFKDYDSELIEEYINKENKIKEINKNKENKEKKITEDISNKINKFMKHFDKGELKICFKSKVKKGLSGKLSIEFDNKGKKIDKLSEGEKKIIALSYFFTNLENNFNSLKKSLVVILDDPFDSNDHTKIHLLQNIPFEIEENKEYGLSNALKKYGEIKKNNENKLVILTHDVKVIYSFISNLKLKNKKELSFYKMNHNESIEIREWIKTKKDEIREEIINSRSFFPNEEKIKKNLLNIKKEINNLNVDSLRLFWFVLLRLYDGNDSERGKYKNLLSSAIWSSNNKIKYKTKNQKEIEKGLKNLYKNKINKEKLKEISENLVLKNEKNEKIKFCKKEINLKLMKKLKFDDDEAKIMLRFLERICKYINMGYEKKSWQIFQRLRHKNYDLSTIVAYGLEEF